MKTIDRKIISQLVIDGRTTYKDLGKIVGYSIMGAKNRVDRLLKEQAIKVSAQMNVKYFGICMAVVLMEMEKWEDTCRLLERFKECPRIVYIFTTTGGYNVVALVIAEDKDTLESIAFGRCSIRSGKGIRRSEFYPVRDIYYSPFLPIRENLTHKGLTLAPCKVDCVSCERYVSKKCVGCPSTKHYRGSL
ncbi:MAG: AsnC family transcriptional regulator [Candidatus Bathyarchaeota archaeon B26-1]|mgnify:CR=1 FL=1|nr:MAG: AsnC family transcriptional regulator [Candidatus Bathyarchaeota archaeon B26-1]